MKRYRIVFSGSGGQGIVTASIIFAEAAVIYETMIAVQSQTYGPEARGGSARSDVIISDTKINYPKVVQPNVLVCLTQEAYDKYCAIIRPGGLLITDTRYVKTERIVDARQAELAMHQTVMNRLGKSIVFNICMLGVLLSFTGIINSESIIKVLENRIPAGFLEMNKKALHLGIAIAKEFNEVSSRNKD